MGHKTSQEKVLEYNSTLQNEIISLLEKQFTIAETFIKMFPEGESLLS